LVGYTPSRDYRYIDINRSLRACHPSVVAQITADILQDGGTVERDADTDLLHINGEFSASIVIARCQSTAAGAHRWRVL
jgi:hypothetical protein